jgi:hypothetical protein
MFPCMSGCFKTDFATCSNIGDIGASSLATSLTRNHTLIDVNLSGNNIVMLDVWSAAVVRASFSVERLALLDNPLNIAQRATFIDALHNNGSLTLVQLFGPSSSSPAVSLSTLSFRGERERLRAVLRRNRSLGWNDRLHLRVLDITLVLCSILPACKRFLNHGSVISF